MRSSFLTLAVMTRSTGSHTLNDKRRPISRLLSSQPIFPPPSFNYYKQSYAQEEPVSDDITKPLLWPESRKSISCPPKNAVLRLFSVSTSIPFKLVLLSFSFGSSRANPKRGPPQPKPSNTTRSSLPGFWAKIGSSALFAASEIFINITPFFKYSTC